MLEIGQSVGEKDVLGNRMRESGLGKVERALKNENRENMMGKRT